MRNRAPALGAALLLGITAGLLGLSASASGSAASALAVKPKPSPSPSPPPAPSGTFMKAYAALVNGSQLNLTPLDVQATSDWVSASATYPPSEVACTSSGVRLS